MDKKAIYFLLFGVAPLLIGAKLLHAPFDSYHATASGFLAIGLFNIIYRTVRIVRS